MIPAGSEQRVTAYAPATVSNLIVGFDVLGIALEGPGDTVSARLVDTPGVTITRVVDAHKRPLALTTDAKKNTAGVAAASVLAKAGMNGVGVELEVTKALEIGTGLGSSAASAAAAAFAVNALIGSPLRRHELVGPCIDAEAVVAGRHADNVAPAVLGGLILVRSIEPLDLVRIPAPADLHFVVVQPRFELLTRESRAALPKDVPLAEMVRQTANIAALVSACHTGDLGLLARSMGDMDVVTLARGKKIPGGPEAIRAAREAGAISSSISGSGPSIFAICRSLHDAHVAGRAMAEAFKAAGLESHTVTSPADCPGARRV